MMRETRFREMYILWTERRKGSAMDEHLNFAGNIFALH